MNERQCVPAPESLLIGCMQTYLWRDERSGRCYFRLETRQEMPMKEMIRDSYVKNNLDNKEIRWNVINCDATQAGISFFKERTRPSRRKQCFETAAATFVPVRLFSIV